MCKREYDGAPGAEDCKKLRDSVVIRKIASYLNLDRVVRMRGRFAGGDVGGPGDEIPDGTGGCHC